jgi:hypothetical protein
LALDFGDLFARMFEAGASAFGANWGRVQDFAQQEFTMLARRIVEIETRVQAGLDQQIATHLFNMQKNTAVMIIAGLTTLTVLSVEAAINAVFAVVRETVNTAVGFALI